MNASPSNAEPTADGDAPVATPSWVVRSIVGGVLMGLANLVPGISGGTMLVASGIYTRFINAIAEVSTLTFRRQSLLTLACVVAAAGVSIILFAGTIKGLVVDYRWVMYSIFIGLTLGGVPVVWKMVNRPDGSVAIGALIGFAIMVGLAASQWSEAGTGAVGEANMLMMFIAGVAGASAMILPGVSGGYLLLVLGVYVPILAAIDAIKSQGFSAEGDPFVRVALPVGFGVVVGVVAVSNVFRFLLKRYEKPTLGVLLGLLIGAVVGIYPFQEGVAPAVGEQFKGDAVILVDGALAMETTGKLIEADDYPTAFFQPNIGQIGGALGLILAGFAATALIARFSAEKPTSTDQTPTKD